MPKTSTFRLPRPVLFIVVGVAAISFGSDIWRGINAAQTTTLEVAAAQSSSIAYLAEHFPEEAAAVVARVEDGKARGEDLTAVTIKELTNLRRSLAPAVAVASDDALVAVIEHTKVLYETVLAGEGQEGCATFFTTGVAAKIGTDQIEKYRAIQAAQAVALLAAARDGLDNPVGRDAMSGEDLTVLQNLMEAETNGALHWSIVLDGNSTDPEFCAASIAFYTALANPTDPAIGRSRAAIVQDLALQ